MYPICGMLSMMGLPELQRLVEGSELSAQDKDLWLRALEMMDDEQAQAILESVADDPTELEALTRNVKLKQVAFAQGDHTLMEQVLEDEVADVSRA